MSADTYGFCEQCGAPRDVRTTTTETVIGGEIERFDELICTAAPDGHDLVGLIETARRQADPLDRLEALAAALRFYREP